MHGSTTTRIGLGAIAGCIAVGTLALAGCGGGSTSTTASSTAASQTTSTSSASRNALIGVKVAQASRDVALYCVKAIGYKVGRNPIPSDAVMRAKQQGVDTLATFVAKSPNVPVGKSETVRTATLAAIDALRNGKCDVGAATALQAAVGAPSTPGAADRPANR